MVIVLALVLVIMWAPLGLFFLRYDRLCSFLILSKNIAVVFSFALSVILEQVLCIGVCFGLVISIPDSYVCVALTHFGVKFNNDLQHTNLLSHLSSSILNLSMPKIIHFIK